MVRELLENIVNEFNRKVDDDPSFAKEAREKDRTIQFLFDDGESYNMTLGDGRLQGVLGGPLDGADITIMTDTDTFQGLVSGEISAMRAYATKKLRLKASLQDLMTLRKFFG